MGGEKMETIGYDVTDEYDIGDNGNFHGKYVDIKSRKPLPEDDPKRIYSQEKRSLDFINEYAGKRPFFLMVSQYVLHVPHKASADVIEKYCKLPRGKYCRDEDYKDPSEMSKGFMTCAWRLQYAAMIDEVDTGLGKMIDLLDKKGEYAGPPLGWRSTEEIDSQCSGGRKQAAADVIFFNLPVTLG